MPGIRARGIPGGRAKDAAHGGAVRVVGHGAFGGAVTGGGEHDRVPEASVEPGGAVSPEMLAGEDRRVVHVHGAPRRLRGAADDPDGAEAHQEAHQGARQDGDQEPGQDDPRPRRCSALECHGRPRSGRVANANPVIRSSLALPDGATLTFGPSKPSAKENVRAQLRVLVKRILRKHGYPPDRQARATELLLEQPEVRSELWAVA